MFSNHLFFLLIYFLPKLELSTLLDVCNLNFSEKNYTEKKNILYLLFNQVIHVLFYFKNQSLRMNLHVDSHVGTL